MKNPTLAVVPNDSRPTVVTSFTNRPRRGASTGGEGVNVVSKTDSAMPSLSVGEQVILGIRVGERVMENKNLMAKAGVIAKKEAETSIKTLRNLMSTAEVYVNAGSISDKDKRFVEGYEAAAKKGEAAFKAICG